MIVDCHTHIWQAPEQLGSGSAEYLQRQLGRREVSATPEEHQAAAECVDCTFVLGLRSKLLDAEIPNRFIADYARKYPGRVIGMAGVDPAADDVDETLAMADEDRAFAGIVLSPAASGVHPADSRMWKIYQFCCDHGLPIMLHSPIVAAAASKMEFAHPYLWDEVLREHGDLRLVIAHMGYPWVDETLVLLGKHPHVYADVAGLIRRPWLAYNALVAAHQFGVTDKLLFGSDFPFSNAQEAIEGFYRINQVAHGTALPVVPRKALRAMIERDTLPLLGIGSR